MVVEGSKKRSYGSWRQQEAQLWQWKAARSAAMVVEGSKKRSYGSGRQQDAQLW